MKIRSTICLIVVTLLAPAALAGQQSSVIVRVVSEDEPVAGATVVASDSIGAITDDAGEARLQLPAGEHRVVVEAFGYEVVTFDLAHAAGHDTVVVVELEADAHEIEEIIVSSTRTERRIEDEPIRVEVIGREEVEEKLLMTPGDISMLLNETSGLRVQATAPALGGAGVRIQGLRGRYTQILADGLPLHGGQTGALGPLQIPPMDLGQVEVIKGAASALYGASAMGGVVNLIARRPADDNERELLLNQSTLGGTDVVLWNSGPITPTLGYTLLASGHRQDHVDVDEDEWADLPRFRRGTIRPRLFWNNDRGASALITIGGMLEERTGGTVPGGETPDGSSYVEALDTERLDAGVVARFLAGASTLVSVRGSAALQRHEHRFGAALDDDEHRTAFAEAALAQTRGALTWVGGLAFQRDEFRNDSLPAFDYTHAVPGAFAQADVTPWEAVSLSASARVDHHDELGTFFSPRVSLLLRPGEWSVRASAGTGWLAPTPFTDETEAVGLRNVVPPSGLDAERARSASLDVGRTLGDLELNATLFGAIVDDAVQARLALDDRLELFNAEDDARTWGSELLARYHVEGLHVTATYVFLRATEPDPESDARRDVPLTPRHTAGIVAAWEQEGRGRFGAELYFTGRQSLEHDPYRDEAEPHVIVGFLVERRFGPARVFLNAENIFDTRQTRHDPLMLPERSAEGRWTTDVWAPLEGRAFNGGVRLEF